VPTIIENKTKEITDYVISLVVAFLGSSAFYAIVKAITSHGARILKDKISELEKQNQISQKAKEIYEAKIADLENTLVDATEKIDVVLEQFTKYLELDAAKQKQAAELLEKLLPPVDNNDNKKEGE
jgi:lipoate-protein ligase A